MVFIITFIEAEIFAIKRANTVSVNRCLVGATWPLRDWSVRKECETLAGLLVLNLSWETGRGLGGAPAELTPTQFDSF